MSRGHQHGDRGPAPAQAAEAERVEVDPDLAELLALGNQALGERILSEASAHEPLATRVELGTRLGLALRVAPRDGRWTERLIEVVERSGLEAERKEAITSRLRWDQVLADDVSRAVTAAIGADTAAARSAVIDAVESAPEGSPELLAQRVAEHTGAAGEQATALVRALTLVRPFWDEEEEEAPPGDYLAETGGS